MEEKNNQNNISKVRIWTENQKNKNTNPNIFNSLVYGFKSLFNPMSTKYRAKEVLFDSIIYELSRFGAPIPREYNTPESMEKIRREYSGDASLFEFGCYLFFQIDLWCFRNNKEEWRRTTLNYLTNQFLSLFKEILNIENIEQIFANRLDLYTRAIQGKLTWTSLVGRNKDDVKNDDKKVFDILHFYLTQLILKTANNTVPKIYEFDKDGHFLLGSLALDAVRIALIFSEITNWEVTMLPACIESIKNSMIIEIK